MIHVEFLKKGAPFGLAYMAGQMGSIQSENVARELEELGVVRIIEEQNTLPDDIPGRKQLIENGIKSIDELSNISDFTELEGISKTIDKRIKAYLNK